MPTALDLAIEHSSGDARNAGRPVAPPQQASCVVRVLVSLVGWGIISSVILQRIAGAVIDDFEAAGATAPVSLQKLAKLGVCGDHSRNCRRDLMR